MSTYQLGGQLSLFFSGDVRESMYPPFLDLTGARQSTEVKTPNTPAIAVGRLIYSICRGGSERRQCRTRVQLISLL